jgi:hypothetical protein
MLSKLFSDRGRVARLIALAGVLAVVLATKSLVIPRVPVDRDVEVRLPSPATVLAVDVRWSAAGTSEDIATTSLHFSAGSAPASVRTTAHLPDGDYDVAIDVERISGVDSTRRLILLRDSARVTIPLQ